MADAVKGEAVRGSAASDAGDAVAQRPRAQSDLPVKARANGHPDESPAGRLSRAGSTASLTNTEHEDPEVARLRAELEQMRDRVQAAEAKLHSWESLVEDALHSALFSPEANDRYRTYASHTCTSSLLELPQVTRVKYVRCSFPSLRRDAPRVRLHKYHSLHHSEWDVSWAPSWSVDLQVEGLHYLYFELGMRVRGLKLTGRLRVDLVSPLGQGGVKLGFVKYPKVGMDLETSVSLGFVPVPIQDQIADIVRAQMDDWLVKHIVMPRAMHFKPFGSSTPAPPSTARTSTFRGEGSASTHDLGPHIMRKESCASLNGSDGAYDVDDEMERAVLAALTHRMTGHGL